MLTDQTDSHRNLNDSLGQWDVGFWVDRWVQEKGPNKQDQHSKARAETSRDRLTCQLRIAGLACQACALPLPLLLLLLCWRRPQSAPRPSSLSLQDAKQIIQDPCPEEKKRERRHSAGPSSPH